MSTYLQLAFISLFPVITSILLELYGKHHGINPDGNLFSITGESLSFSNTPDPTLKKRRIVRQIIIGIIFGCVAILGNECGVSINDANVNTRDAAALSAGLLFGGPAGIIAGLIGGIERWVSVVWNGGYYTRLACSISTVIAGLYAAILRKALFENKRPSWAIAFAIGAVMEVLHMTNVCITHLNDPVQASLIVSSTTVPLVIINSCSVMLSTIAVNLVWGKQLWDWKKLADISTSIRRVLFICVIIGYFLTSGFMFLFQTSIAKADAADSMNTSIEDLIEDISYTLDKQILNTAQLAAKEITEKCSGSVSLFYESTHPVLSTQEMQKAAQKLGVSEIHLIDLNGVISATSKPESFGFDMKSGEQSNSFLEALSAQSEYVQEYGAITQDANTYMKYAGVAIDGGFVQIGCDTDNLKDAILKEVSTSALHRHIDSSGEIYIVDTNDIIVSGPEDFIGKSLRNTSLYKKICSHNPNKLIKVSYEGTEYYCVYRASHGFKLIATLPKDHAMKNRRVNMFIFTFLEVLVFAILFLVMYLMIKKRVVKPIHRINDNLSEITGGNLDQTVNIRSSLEFQMLSEGINTTVGALKGYITQAEERYAADMAMAATIQTSVLPSVFPAYPQRSELDIYAMMEPAKEVGGDFYDFYLSHTDIFNFLIADVSGKGLPAALFMMRAKALLKNLTESDAEVHAVFSKGNNELCIGNDASMFVTAWQGQIDFRTGLLQYTNAGHNPPLIRRENGTFEYLKGRSGFVLAGMEDFSYRLQTEQLQPGDIVVLYTDGVTEATNAAEELYGEQRLLDTVNACSCESMEQICKDIKADVDAFVGDAPQFDDITILAFRYMPDFGRIQHQELTITPDIEQIPIVSEFVEQLLAKYDCPVKTRNHINVVIDELFSNISKYGYLNHDDPNIAPGKITVRLEASTDPNYIKLRFMDNGTPFNPLKRRDPDITASAEERALGGLGIYIVKNLMDTVNYEYIDDMNILTLIKYF